MICCIIIPLILSAICSRIPFLKYRAKNKIEQAVIEQEKAAAWRLH